MKKGFIIFLAGIYMLSFAEFHQFLRMPVLVQHFIEHRQLDPGISLFAFLKLHYVQQYLVDDDYQRDKQLPFREADCCIINSTISVECTTMTIELPVCSFETKNDFFLYDEDDHSFLATADIFQPPRCS